MRTTKSHLEEILSVLISELHHRNGKPFETEFLERFGSATESEPYLFLSSDYYYYAVYLDEDNKTQITPLYTMNEDILNKAEHAQMIINDLLLA